MFTVARASTLLMLVVFGALLDEASHAVHAQPPSAAPCDNKCRDRLYMIKCDTLTCYACDVPDCISCVATGNLCNPKTGDNPTYACMANGGMVTYSFSTTTCKTVCDCPKDSAISVEASGGTVTGSTMVNRYTCQ